MRVSTRLARWRLAWPGGKSLSAPALLALMPAAILGAFWLGGDVALLALAVGLPLGVLSSQVLRSASGDDIPRDSVTGLMLRHGFDVMLENAFAQTRDGALKSACFVIELDDVPELRSRHGQATLDTVLQKVSDRLEGSLRGGDNLARLSDSRLAVCLQPVRNLDLELCLQMANRLQDSVEIPMQSGDLTFYVSCSVGFCLRSRAPDRSAQGWLDAAVAALDDAAGNGPGSVRAYTPELRKRHEIRETLQRDLIEGLEKGEIQPWFQPQLDTDTGLVSGFEALARWVHPVRGVVPPAQFLPAVEAMGLMTKLTQSILRDALQTLKSWDAAGMVVPHISVNLSQQDLSDPRLCEKIGWHLDSTGLEPVRLCLEILETVVADSPEDIVVRNIGRLHNLGCAIDLDDYGTGHASIAALRRFPVNRIKIDRSFITKSDRDPEQRRIISAILSMAERLELDTLAEGVETAGEHAFLAQLGCTHVQGFGIAHPMPAEDAQAWMDAHKGNLGQTPVIGPGPA